MAHAFTVRRNKKRPSRLVLTSDIGIAAADELHHTLTSLASELQCLNVDCRNVDHLDGAILQLLMCAKLSWPNGAEHLGFINISDALEHHLASAGAGAVIRTASDL